MKLLENMDMIVVAAGAKEIELSGWNPGEVVRVKLRRPSMVNMISNGQVPNPLLGVVSKLFSGDPGELSKANERESAEAVRLIARAALVEPSMEQLDAAGVELTDEQYMEIYAFVLGGVNGLSRFRRVTRG